MTNTVPLRATIDHAVIKSWAERRSARPSMPSRHGRWPLVFEFGPIGPGVKEIDWATFFAAFESSNVAFVYRDVAPDGSLDDLHEFVSRAAVPALTASVGTTIVERVV
jgi:hypothetical protein